MLLKSTKSPYLPKGKIKVFLAVKSSYKANHFHHALFVRCICVYIILGRTILTSIASNIYVIHIPCKVFEGMCLEKTAA